MATRPGLGLMEGAKYTALTREEDSWPASEGGSAVDRSAVRGGGWTPLRTPRAPQRTSLTPAEMAERPLGRGRTDGGDEDSWDPVPEHPSPSLRDGSLGTGTSLVPRRPNDEEPGASDVEPGASMLRKAQLAHSVYAYSPRWEERRRHPLKAREQEAQQDKAKKDNEKRKKQEVEHARTHYGPLAERVEADQKLRYGEMFFEESGRVVPYIIAPEGVKEEIARKKAAEKLLAAMVKTTKKGASKRLSKPNITFRLLGHGRHYLEWAREVYENDALAEAWGWCSDEDTAATRIQTRFRGWVARRAIKYAIETSERQLMGLVIEATLASEKKHGPRNARTPAGRGTKAARLAIRPIDKQVSVIEWRFIGEQHTLRERGGRSVKFTEGTPLGLAYEVNASSKRLEITKIDEGSQAWQQGDTIVVGDVITKVQEMEIKHGAPGLEQLRKHIDQRPLTLELETSATKIRWHRGSVKDARDAMLKASRSDGNAKPKRVMVRWHIAGQPDPASRFELQVEEAQILLEYVGATISSLKEVACHGLDIDAKQREEIEYYSSTTPAMFRAVQEHRPYILRALLETVDPDMQNAKLPDQRTGHVNVAAQLVDITSRKTLQQFVEERGGIGARNVLHGKRVSRDRPASVHEHHGISQGQQQRGKIGTETLQARAERLGYDTGECGSSSERLIAYIIDQSKEAIRRRTRRREARLTSDNNEDIDFSFKANDTSSKCERQQTYANLKKKLESVSLCVEQQLATPDASKKDAEKAKSDLETATEFLEKLSDFLGPKEQDKTKQQERAPETKSSTISDRLRDLAWTTKWEESFRDALRNDPTLGAKLGLPLDLDRSAFTRMVADITENVRLDSCPITAIENKIREHSGHMVERACKEFIDRLNACGIGPKSESSARRCSCNRTSICRTCWRIVAEKTNVPTETEPGDKETFLAYLDWLRNSTVDRQKVRIYFLSNVEEELRKELNKMKEWEARPRCIPLDRAMIEFGDRMVSVFSNILSGTVNSDGWLLCPADRGPVSQLIGETIERLDGAKGELKDLVWMQYAALRNPRLGGAANHTKFVQQLRDASVELNDSGEKTAELASRVFYHSDRVLYPTSEDIQGRVVDDSGREVSAQDWMRDKIELIEDQKGDLHLHPRCTHLIFWDTEGSVTKTVGGRPLEQPLPHEQVEAFEAVLRQEGVANGLLMVNGDEFDFDVAKRQVSQSDPVLCLNAVGGASDFMSGIFSEFKKEGEAQKERGASSRRRQAQDDEKKKLGKLGMRKLRQEAQKHKVELKDDDDKEDVLEQLSNKKVELKFPTSNQSKSSRVLGTEATLEKALVQKFRRGEHLNEKFKPQNGHKGKFYFKPRQTCADEEMMVINVPPPRTPSEHDAGQMIQKHLAEMLTMQGDEKEQMLGFKAAEHQRLSFSWDQALHYEHNAFRENIFACVVQLAMLVINLCLVALVVFKQALYPGGHHGPCAATVHDGETPVDEEHEGFAEDDEKPLLMVAFKAGLMIMPIANGILLTLANAFSPTPKRNALRWTAAKIESEIYMYRARADRYSPVNTSVQWSFIGRQEHNSDEENDARQKRQQGQKVASKTFVDTIAALCNRIFMEGVFVASHLNYWNEKERIKRRTEFLEDLKEHKLFVKLEEVDTATGTQAPKTKKYKDDGYSLLDISEYIACRTEPLLARYQNQLPRVGRFDMIFVRQSSLQ